MESSYDYSLKINEVITKTAHSIDEFKKNFDPQVRVADERFGDFQANGVLPYAKKNGLKGRIANVRTKVPKGMLRLPRKAPKKHPKCSKNRTKRNPKLGTKNNIFLEF